MVPAGSANQKRGLELFCLLYSCSTHSFRGTTINMVLFFSTSVSKYSRIFFFYYFTMLAPKCRDNYTVHGTTLL